VKSVTKQAQPAMSRSQVPDAIRKERDATLSANYAAEHPGPTALEKNIHFQKFADNIALPMISWAVGDGMGKAVGEGLSLLKGASEIKNLYRFDTRSIGEIKAAGGFNSQGIDMNIIEHANGNNIFNKTSGYVPTTSSLKSAINFAGNREGYIYTLNPQLNGVDVNKALGKLSRYPWEKEVAVPLNIPASDIKAVKKIGGN
jgi:hypothetical protein